jgi:hypothetical protein
MNLRIEWFLLACLVVDLGLSLVVQLRRYRHRLTIPVFGISLLLPATTWLGVLMLRPEDGMLSVGLLRMWPHRVFLASFAVMAALVTALTVVFMRGDSLGRSRNGSRKELGLMAALAIGATAIAARAPWGGTAVASGKLFLVLNALGTVPALAVFGLTAYAFFLLEDTYRHAQPYQRKIGRLCFLSLLVLLAAQLLLAGRMVLYRSVGIRVLESAAVAMNVAWPFVLLGFIRYRLGTERVSIPRESVYSSLSLLLIGSLSLGAGLTAAVFQWFDLDFTHFERSLLVFSTVFVIVLAAGSGTMRARIARFVNTRFYTYKYDYREQFYNLHRTFMTGANLEAGLIEMVETMKWSVTADDAFVFVLDEQSGDYRMHPNQEAAVPADVRISGDSPLVAALDAGRSMVDFTTSQGTPAAHGETMPPEREPVVRELRISRAFAIRYRKQLPGILGLRFNRPVTLDQEDLDLITAFTSSMADVLFKNRILRERIEQKQFQSFTHVASFIAHDIKNQVATLSLVVKNAEKNIDNPAFQQSLMTSLRSTTANLRFLVEKLNRPPRPEAINLRRGSVDAVVERVVADTSLRQLGNTTYRREGSSGAEVAFDEDSLYYVVKNLVVNALEAMGERGELSIVTGDIRGLPEEPVRDFGGGAQFWSRYRAYVLVRDTGPGMSEAFVRDRLFRPFVTTKDKGVGIGLYQCKTLTERMGGKLLCRSVEGEGTRFCVVLG